MRRCALAAMLLGIDCTPALADNLLYNASGQLTSVTTSPGAATSPMIVTHPVSAVLESGQPFALAVKATGLGLNYQWYKDNELLPGETRATLLFSSITAANLGSYRVQVSNYGGSTPSNVAVLSFPLNAYTTPMGGIGDEWRSGGTTRWAVINDPAQVRVSGNPVVGTGRAFSDDSFVESNVTVTQASTVRFWMRLPSIGEPEEFSGQLFPCRVQVQVNGRVVREVQTNYELAGWQQYQIHLPQAGTYTLTWQHLENGYVLLDDLTISNAVDTDMDGLSDEWEMEFFQDLDPLATDDDDYDRSKNLAEYHDLTGPLNTSSYLIHLTLDVIGNGQVQRSVPEGTNGYPRDHPVITELTPVPDPGNVFVSWLPDFGIRNNVAVLPVNMDYPLTVQARFEPQVPLATGADTTTATWTTSSPGAWISQTQTSSDGVDALMSGPLPVSNEPQTTWVQATITGPAKVSYEMRNDHATGEMTVDGTNVGHHLPNYIGNWTPKEIYLPAGSHVLRWTVRHPDVNPASPSISYLDKVVIIPHVDSDHDGMADEWETQFFGNLSRNGTADFDNDGSPDLLEYTDLTNPNDISDHRVRLTFATTGTGSGTVQAVPARASYHPTDRLLITASPAPGSILQNWEAGIYTFETNPIDLYVGSLPDITITARFMAANALNEALDNTALVFNNSLPAWTKTTTAAATHDGVDAAQSSVNHSNYTMKAITADVTGPKVMYFWWKLDKKEGYSGLAFIDSCGCTTLYDATLGGWQRVVVQLTSGPHTLTWAFDRQDYGAEASMAWLDQVVIGDDSDEDGLPDDWETTHFTTLAATTGAEDFDNDGNSNQLEWTDGTNPKSAASALFRLAVVSGEPNSVQISPVQETYLPSSQVTVTADPAFTAWSGDATGTTNPLVVTMTRSKTITADFQPLSRGVDCTKLLFQTSPTQPWVLNDAAGSAYAGNDVATSPAEMPAGAQSWIETTFTTAGRLTFAPTANFYIGNGASFRWLLDGVEVGSSQYSYSSEPASIFILPGTHTLRWVFDRGTEAEYSGAALLDNLVWTPMTVVPLDEALDAPGTPWTYGSSSTPTWLGFTTTTHDGVDAAETLPLPHGQEAVMQTTINPATPSVLSFWWKVSSEQDFDKLAFFNNGQEMADVQAISGEKGWQKVSFLVPAGPRTLRWVYSKDYSGVGGQDKAWVDQLSYAPVQTFSLVEALDKPGQVWTTSSGAPWTGTNATTHDGVDAAVSGAITDGQTTWVQTEVTGPGVLTFWWKMSGASWDTYRFTVNSVNSTDPLSYETGWRQVTVNLSAGNNVLRWSYARDAIPDPPVGQDSTWLDEVTFTSTAPAFSTWASGFGYSGADAQANGNPMKDGIPNLIKYAFNLAPNASIQGAARHVTPGTGTSGQPSTTTIGATGSKRLRMEYVRRRNATDITYTVQFGSGLNSGDWATAAGTETVTIIDATWERVVIEDTVTSGTNSRRFGRVQVSQNP